MAKKEDVSPVEYCINVIAHAHTGFDRHVYHHGAFANNHIPNVMSIYEHQDISTLVSRSTNNSYECCEVAHTMHSLIIERKKQMAHRSLGILLLCVVRNKTATVVITG